VPAAVFFELWSLLVRRMGAAQGGVLSIGKSKAKVYVESSTGVSFNDVAGIDEARAELIEIVDFLKKPATLSAAEVSRRGRRGRRRGTSLRTGKVRAGQL
jgi:ATP-dependent Zn protease